MAIGGVLFDIDGVLVTSWQPIAGAAATLATLADRGIPRVYLTNTTTDTRAGIAQRLTDAGLPVHADEVFTAAALTADHLRDRYPGARCFLVNSGDVSGDLTGIDVVSATGDAGGEPERPDVIVLGGAGPEYDHRTLSRVYDWMCQGVPVLAMHRSTAWTTADGLRIDTGLYLAGLEQASGYRATVVGKPAPQGFLAAAARLGLEPEEMIAVGDDLRTDVLAAQVAGMTGVLVRTGKFRQHTLDRWTADQFAMAPNHVIDSVADLPGLLGL